MAVVKDGDVVAADAHYSSLASGAPPTPPLVGPEENTTPSATATATAGATGQVRGQPPHWTWRGRRGVMPMAGLTVMSAHRMPTMPMSCAVTVTR